MPLYPTLEDMKVDQLVTAEQQVAAALQQHQHVHPGGASMYPDLQVAVQEYMGMDLSQLHKQYADQGLTLYQGDRYVSTAGGQQQLVAPVTGGDVGVRRAEIKPGLREVTLCKDAKGLVGLRIKNIDNALYIQFVQRETPAALAGCRFGEQVVSINGKEVCGWSQEKAHKELKGSPVNDIKLVLRDRPYARTLTLLKDSQGGVGFTLRKDGYIQDIIVGSSAARNGLPSNHQLLEVDGQNCMGLKDKEMKDLIDAAGQTVTLTVMPRELYDHFVKSMAGGLVKKLMDHSVPAV